MNAKERFYSGLAKETIGKITSNTDNWTSFLRTMSRNYEFTYPEQVMIYAQRPNATFCKPYEDWNAENYRRYVKRGSTGIALFVMNRDKPYLRYVFDVADTGVRRSSPELKPWEVTPENRSYVMEAMERTFGVAADGVLEAQLEDIASALAAEYWDDYKKQFLDLPQVREQALRQNHVVQEHRIVLFQKCSTHPAVLAQRFLSLVLQLKVRNLIISGLSVSHLAHNLYSFR